MSKGILPRFSKILLICSILLPIAHFSFLQSLAISQNTPKFPAISINEALQLAEIYVGNNKLNITGQFINSIQLEYDDGLRLYPDGKKRIGHYWYINWRWAKPKLGGEHSIKIFMNGEIIWETHGP